MAVIKNNKTGMWEVRTYYKGFDRSKEAEKPRGALPRRAKPLNGSGISN